MPAAFGGVQQARHGEDATGIARLRKCSSAITELRRQHRWEEAIRVLKGARVSGLRVNLVTYGGVIATCSKAGRWAPACAFLGELVRGGLEPNTIACNAAISACSSEGCWPVATAMIRDMQRARHAVDSITINAGVSACSMDGQWERAVRLCSKMHRRATRPDVVSYNAAIKACEVGRCWGPPLALLEEMAAGDVVPDTTTYNVALSAFEKAQQWKSALMCLEDMLRGGFEPDRIAFTTVATACERCRELTAAVKVAMKLAVPRPPGRAAATSDRPRQPAQQPASSVRSALAAGGYAQREDVDAPVFQHVSVMLPEVVEAFAAADLAEGAIVVDCTLGGAGHSEALLEQCPGVRLLGIDRDERALEAAGARLRRFGHERVRLMRGDFGDVSTHIRSSGWCDGASQVAGILADLGVSSPQLDCPERGFSFRADGPLDMRMDGGASGTRPAAWYLAHLGVSELAAHLSDLGEEPHADAIARCLVEEQPQTTVAAANLVKACVLEEAGPEHATTSRNIHPATRTFQALRMLVNGELDSIRSLLAAAPASLAVGGLFCVISFHSLEDRLVRKCIAGDDRRWAPDDAQPGPATGRVSRSNALSAPFVAAGGREGTRPSDEEVSRNPRSRSARLRIAVRRA
mmetsp:Transcript_19334/g.53077  ORF Transcript_19334/g.53077 Transcript_19334/m.53077 type:complete len:635 (+) Transcript_19334:70-1974(+)